MATPSTDVLVDGLRRRNRRAAGRLISLIEDQSAEVEAVMREVYPYTGKAYFIGVTGPPGAGKSTVVDELIRVVRETGDAIAVVAVDPNSPFSGGAILGDRIRMMRHASDSGVFIRSMGARGHLGGIATATLNAMLILDAMGNDIVLVETVGVGQSELEVASTADTTIVILPPGQGDGVQAIKAGIMEIADVYVVNKADHPQTKRTVAELRELLRTAPVQPPWVPPIVETIGTQNAGIEDLWEAITKHRDYLERSGELEQRRTDRIEREIVDIVERRLRSEFLLPQLQTEEFTSMVQQAARRELSPYEVAERLLPADRLPRKQASIGR